MKFKHMIFACITIVSTHAIAMEQKNNEQPAQQPFNALKLIEKSAQLPLLIKKDDKLINRNLLMAELTELIPEYTEIRDNENPALAILDWRKKYNDASKRFSKSCQHDWALEQNGPAVATATCCLLSALKPFLGLWFSYVPTEYCTMFFGGVWGALVKERTPHRISVNTMSTTLDIINKKIETLINEEKKQKEKGE